MPDENCCPREGGTLTEEQVLTEQIDRLLSIRVLKSLFRGLRISGWSRRPRPCCG